MRLRIVPLVSDRVLFWRLAFCFPWVDWCKLVLGVVFFISCTEKIKRSWVISKLKSPTLLESWSPSPLTLKNWASRSFAASAFYFLTLPEKYIFHMLKYWPLSTINALSTLNTAFTSRIWDLPPLVSSFSPSLGLHQLQLCCISCIEINLQISLSNFILFIYLCACVYGTDPRFNNYWVWYGTDQSSIVCLLSMLLF